MPGIGAAPYSKPAGAPATTGTAGSTDFTVSYAAPIVVSTNPPSVYGTTPPGYAFFGCYTEVTLLPFIYTPPTGTLLTANACLAGCQARGYTYAALAAGT